MRKHVEQRGFRNGRSKLACVRHIVKPMQILSGFSLESVMVCACQRLNKLFSDVSVALVNEVNGREIFSFFCLVPASVAERF